MASLKHPPESWIPPAKVLVPVPVTLSAPVERLVVVALVIVALVARRLVKVAAVAVKIEANKLVEVAAVVVERMILLQILAPENVLESAKSVEDADEPVERHTPAIAKQPVEREIPFWKVLLALPVTLSCVAESPPAKVLVPCPAPTVIAAAKVLVAEVLVAEMTLKTAVEPK